MEKTLKSHSPADIVKAGGLDKYLKKHKIKKVNTTEKYYGSASFTKKEWDKILKDLEQD